MEDDELLSIVGNPDKTDEEKAQQLIELTKNNADNHSAYLIKVKDVLIDPVADNSLMSDELELRAKNKALNDTRKNEAWSEDSAPVAPVQKPASKAPSFQPQPAKKDIKKSLLSYGIMGVLSILMLIIGVGLGLLFFFHKEGETPEGNPSVTNTQTQTRDENKHIQGAPAGTPRVENQPSGETTEQNANPSDSDRQRGYNIGPTVPPGNL
jgi:hypothetical protein